jgi:putative ATP-binding cassette transporter
VNTSFNTFGSLVPFFASAPKVMSGEMSAGTLMQSSAAFSMVLISVSWIALVYSRLVVFSAVIQRLVGLEQATEAHESPGIRVQESPSTALGIDGLELRLPDGTPVAQLGDVEIRPGERVLLRGPTGTGKSTLLRAVAGLWPFGRGRIVVPAGVRMMMLPQKSYIADGTLKEAVAYPRGADEVSDDDCQRVLQECELGHIAHRLHEHHRWGHLLSGGEQQKLAFARALLYRPDLLFLDEATSALDEAAEARLYARLCADLPACTLVSVAHRTTVDRFHDRQLMLEPARA